MKQRDLYAVLGVSRGATADEIKRAYKKLAAQLHPDKNPGKKDVEARFKEVNGAYQVLSDPKKKALYDEFGEIGLREGFDPDQYRAYRGGGGRAGASGGRVADDFFGQGTGGGFDFSEIFGDILGGAGRTRGRGRGRAGQDVEARIRVDFRTCALGGTVSVVPLPGAQPVEVRVPAGIEPGTRLRVTGKGAPGAAGGPPGDLLLSVEVQPHAHFTREGLDVHLSLPVTPLEAFDGAKVRVPTLDGSVVAKLPERAQSGQVIRLKGKGIAPSGGTPGDLYVKLLVRLPTDDAARPHVEALEKLVQGDVRADIKL